MKKLNNENTTDWRSDRNRVRRAERLLLSAEEADRDKARREAKKIEFDRVAVERTVAKQVLADEWNALFKTLDLPLAAKVQTTRWSSKDGPDPEIYVHSEGREESWAALVECLKGLTK